MAENEKRAPTTSSATSKQSPVHPGPKGPFAEANLNNNGPGSALGPGFSPGPMTLVSNFLSDSNNFKSFSQLLAGATASPNPGGQLRPSFLEQGETSSSDDVSGGRDVDFRFKQNRQPGLVIAQPPPISRVPPGLSPATLLDFPNLGLFSPAQRTFGMTHQQALAQVTTQAQAQSQMQIPAKYSSSLESALPASLTQIPSFTANKTTHEQMPPSLPDSSIQMKKSSDFSQSDQIPQSPSYSLDKPADDPYNWRKYGQKQVKGCEFPRSYYKCTHPSCTVKKKVEQSLDGQITEIIYKGHHNHPPPQSNKCGKDAGSLNGISNNQGNSEFASQGQSGNMNKLKNGVPGFSMSKKDHESSQLTAENISGTCDSEEVDDAETVAVEKDEDEPNPKRRNTEVRASEPSASHRTVTEPRIIVQTTSEVDLLDDGYRWRKYGQKVVKGNPYPRSYYKCTTPGCNVRKHVGRASTDPKAVITTYEGKHSHDVPAAKNSSHNTANNNASQTKPQNAGKDFGNDNQQPLARLRLKEEHLT